MIALRPAIRSVARAFGVAAGDLEVAATERWQIAPAERVFVPPALFLPGQLGRIRRTAFGTPHDVARDLVGGFEVLVDATMGYRVRNAELVDGVLYAGTARRHLRPRTGLGRESGPRAHLSSAALYESWPGNRWFGNWLVEDCVAYRLATRFATPVTSRLISTGHMADYEARLGMAPLRTMSARFDELVFFRDMTSTSDRRGRAGELREVLVRGRAVGAHPGVFLLRGRSGDRRLLLNETQLAYHLADRHGFAVIAPEAASASEIIAACAGASVVVGVEGSQLAHGLAVMPAHAALLVIQPPDRACSVLKLATDRAGQPFAFVVGRGSTAGFIADPSEVEATLALIREAQCRLTAC